MVFGENYPNIVHLQETRVKPECSLKIKIRFLQSDVYYPTHQQISKNKNWKL